MPLPLLRPLNLPELVRLDDFAPAQADQLIEWNAHPADVCLCYGQGFRTPRNCKHCDGHGGKYVAFPNGHFKPCDACNMTGDDFNWHLPHDTFAAWTRAVYGPRRGLLVESWAYSQPRRAERSRKRALRAFPEVERRQTVYYRNVGGSIVWDVTYGELEARTQRLRAGRHVSGVKEGVVTFRAFDFCPHGVGFYDLCWEMPHAFAAEGINGLFMERARPHPRGEGM